MSRVYRFASLIGHPTCPPGELVSKTATRQSDGVPTPTQYALDHQSSRNGYCVYPLSVGIEDLQSLDVLLLPENRETLMLISMNTSPVCGSQDASPHNYGYNSGD